MKTRFLCLTMLFVFMSFGIFAQQEKSLRVHQVGINFSSLNSFGLHYKTGSEKTLLRISLLALNLGSASRWGRAEDSIDIKNQSYGAGFRIGFERHVPIVAKFDFIWGLEVGTNFNYGKTTQHRIYSNDYEATEWSVAPLINIILGATYTFSDHLVIGAEITPGFQYSYSKAKSTINDITVEQTTSAFNFGFNTNFANISVAYRFGK